MIAIMSRFDQFMPLFLHAAHNLVTMDEGAVTLLYHSLQEFQAHFFSDSPNLLFCYLSSLVTVARHYRLISPHPPMVL